MRLLTVPVLLCALSSLSFSQAASQSQTARQALIEMFFGTAPNHLEKHLPDVTRSTLKKFAGGSGISPIDEFSMIAAQAKSQPKFETFDTGPILLSTEDPQDGSKLEIDVENDDLNGDEDLIELSVHMIKNAQEQVLPVVPRFTFAMVSQADIWRLNEIDVIVKVPLTDPAFLKTLEDHQRSQTEQMTIWTMRSITSAEQSYSTSEGGYACTLTALADSSKRPEHRTSLFDKQLASGKKGGYIFVISNCDSSHYKVAAEPEAPNSGQRAFCADESGTVRASSDGKATTCLSHGEKVQENTGPVASGVGVAVPDGWNASSTPSVKPSTTGSTASARSTVQRVRVSAGVSQAMSVTKVPPVYPQEAKMARVQGAVVLHAIIGKDGSVQNVNVVSSPSPLLDQAALDAVRQWKYRPYLLNGEAVEVDTQITVNFTLQ